MSASPANARTERLDREDSEAFLASWRARGGFEGALARRGPTAAVGHMPFPGHRTVAEAMPYTQLPVHRLILGDIDRNPPTGAARVIHDAMQREVG